MNKSTTIIVLAICSFSTLCGLYFPTFDEGMDCDNTYKPEYISEKHWQFSKELYETYVSNKSYQTKPIIPKIIHQIWIGSSFPEKYKEFQESWKKHHPSWEYRLWTDKEIRELKLINQAMYDKATNLGEKSDIARYEILYRFGGLYVDTDFECLKSFDYLHHTCCFYAGLLSPRSANAFNVANGLMGSCPGHPLLRECIYTMIPTNDNSPMGIISRTGPYHLARCFRCLLLENALPEYTLMLPVNFLYAFPAWKRFEKTATQWLKDYS